MIGAQRARLSGGRWHFGHGPIDLVLFAEGEETDVARAYEAAWERFATILDELVTELPVLRAPASAGARGPDGAVARRMWRAVLPFAADTFVTPMAAVAGAVAETVLGAMTAAGTLRRAYVNNGGDIALHLAEGARFRTKIADHRGIDLGAIELRDDQHGNDAIGDGDLAWTSGPAAVPGAERSLPRVGSGQTRIRGIATSGRHGRSHSLGIADSVTVLAPSAAVADVAATLIANAVDLPEHPAITRMPASALSPDSDLGDRLVVTGCGPLSTTERGRALDAGARTAQGWIDRGMIAAAFLHLAGETRITAAPGAGRTGRPDAPESSDPKRAPFTGARRVCNTGTAAPGNRRIGPTATEEVAA